MVSQAPSALLGGFYAPWQAAGFLLSRPRLWWLAATPFFINLGLFILFFWLGYTHFEKWLAALLPAQEGWWLSALYYLLLVLAVLALLAMQVFLFAVVGRIIAAPFLEVLTHRVETLSGVDPRELADIGIWQGLGRLIVQELKKLILYLVLMGGLLLLNFLPGLGNIAYTVLAWLLTCFFLTLEFMDYPLERRGLSLGHKLAQVRRLGAGWVTFGTAVLVMGMVPVVNLALLPVAAVAGTLFYLDRAPAAEDNKV
ncbi:MAG: EI24 domain-containing protein [Desulfarculaceae bacterium]|jgi:CysZ protein